MADNDEQISKFIEISGSDEMTAKFYLSSSNGNLENAVSNFLNNDDSGLNNDVDPAPPQLPSSSSFGNDAAKDSSKSAASGFFSKPKPKSKIATLNSVSKDSSDEEEGQAFYAGTSNHSGQQILGPTKRKNGGDHLTELLRLAHEHAHGNHEDDDDESASTGNSNPWGQGVRLGMTDDDHTVVVPTSGSAPGTAGRSTVVLRLWRRGFTVDDGELRPYEDEANKEFLEAVMRGQIPQELVNLGQRLVNIDIDDHRDRDYKPKPQPPSFRGSGQALGSPTPNIVETRIQTGPASSAQVNTVNADKEAQDALSLNSSAPLTTLQIRLANGSRLIGQFNLTHTVGDIRRYIQNARSEYDGRQFILVTSFPTRELNNESETLETAGLKNAVIMQRLK